MSVKANILDFFIRICRFNFGIFEKEEFKKFIRMGFIFALILGTYWTLKALKDSIFILLVDKTQLPYAKTISLLALVPCIMFYTRLLHKTSRERMLVLLPTFYGFAMVLLAGIMLFAQGTQEEIAARPLIPLLGTRFLGYVWYVFSESFGSLLIALFWGYLADTTEPASAKRGFPLIVAIGQVGGIICPYTIAGLPHRYSLSTDTFSILILGGLCFSMIPFVKYFLKKTPDYLLVSFRGKNETQEVKNRNPGFFDGLKLMLKHKYLLAIFGVNFIYEIIITIFDFNFKLAAATEYHGVGLTHFLGMYGSAVNLISLFCLLIGVSNVTRYFGIGIALTAMPFVIGCTFFSFLAIDSLTFLFCLMVGLKAINYALNGPTLKQLYIPTTTEVRFKAQAWVESFGTRTSKEAGSIFNMSLKPLQSVFGELAGKSYYLMLSAAIGFPLIVCWLVLALYLGKKFQRAIDEERKIC